MLTYLSTVSKTPAQRFEVLAQLVSSLFDLSPSMSGHMKIPLWRKCVTHLLDMMAVLQEHRHITVDDSKDSSEEKGEEPPAGQPVKVWGNLVAFVERLDDEMFKSMQFIDPHTHEYTARLKDEPVFLALAQKVADYFSRVEDMKSLARVTLRLVEHLYYKTDAVYVAMRKLTQMQQQQQQEATASTAEPGGENSLRVIKCPRHIL